MADLEKVITGLECCSVKQSCSECPWAGISCNDRLHLAALKLLKEQQETLVSFQSTINKLTKALAEKPKQKFFVDSNGKMTPLPIQKHGHWKTVSDYYDDEHWQCSACGCEWYLEAGSPTENNMHYCPECGAKMDEEVKQDGS